MRRVPALAALPVLVVTCLWLGLGACSDGEGVRSPSAPAGPDSTAGPASVVVGSPQTTFGLAPTTAPSRFAFVDYLVTAGTGGATETLKVWADGRAAYSNGRTVNFNVPPRTVTELRSTLETANLAALPPASGTQTPDARTHRVIFAGQAVRFVDGAMPAELRPAVAILEREMARGRQQR